MPKYQAPLLFRNGHLQTIYPTIFRKINDITYKRERIATPDGDFLDLDWIKHSFKRLAIISHGLEGDSRRAYVMGMARALSHNGFDVLAWNFRGCSGEINLRPRLYHSGSDDDLETVIRHVLKRHSYSEINLVGFSMGGNISLVYLGRRGTAIPANLKRCGVVSLPCDLEAASQALARPANKIYMKRFLLLLHQKIRARKKLFPELFDDTDYRRKVRNFYDFDQRYTAPLHGFSSARDYWRRCSANAFIANIRLPTLLINAADDPFLGRSCYPVRQATANSCFTLEIPEHGGHVGFVAFNRQRLYWSEQRLLSFLKG
jgi:predicted alpha/beta-fold hydrolase